jgi:hypothetical protein
MRAASISIRGLLLSYRHYFVLILLVIQEDKAFSML